MAGAIHQFMRSAPAQWQDKDLTFVGFKGNPAIPRRVLDPDNFPNGPFLRKQRRWRPTVGCNLHNRAVILEAAYIGDFSSTWEPDWEVSIFRQKTGLSA